MISHTPKWIAAGAVSGITHITHAYAILIETSLAGVAPAWAEVFGQVGGWALGATTVLAIVHSIRPTGLALQASGSAFLWVDQKRQRVSNWIGRQGEALLRRGLIRLATSLRHVGLKLQR